MKTRHASQHREHTAIHSALDESGPSLAIVHRDISPQNVLVSVDGTARVLDFGIAKAAVRLHTTKDDRVKGKLHYMAPEQFLDEDVDARTDQVAAGVVLLGPFDRSSFVRSNQRGGDRRARARRRHPATKPR